MIYTKTIFCALILSVPAIAFAGEPMFCEATEGEAEWSVKCQARADIFLTDGGAPLEGKPECARYIPMRKTQSTRCRWYPVKSEQVPGFISEAFYSRTGDDRKIAFDYLENVCRQKDKCAPHAEAYDRELKANIAAWKKMFPLLARRAESLKGSAFKKSP